MSARDELAKLIVNRDEFDGADAILTRGWRPPARVRHLGQRVTDPDVEATYVTLTMVSRVGNTVEFEGQTILDLDPDGHLIGVELIGPVEPKEGE